MAIIVVVGILVAGVLVWALTRTVEPDSVMATATTADATTTFTPPPSDTSALPSTATGTIVPSATSGSVPPPAPAAQPQGNRAEVKRISAEDLRAQVGRNEVTIIDVRASSDYARGHIPGALNIPMASIEAQLDTIPKGKPIVTYCT